MSSDNPIEQVKTSITLGRLKERVDEALSENPSWEDRMVYVDCLAICGTIEENGSILELFLSKIKKIEKKFKKSEKIFSAL